VRWERVRRPKCGGGDGWVGGCGCGGGVGDWEFFILNALVELSALYGFGMSGLS
jgi:hypothetical protein